MCGFVCGVDGKAGPKLMLALSQLCTSGASCGNVALAYETTDTGQGWYYFHHHHIHLSLKNLTFTEAMTGCENPFGCEPTVRSIPKRPTVHRLTPKAL